jgi:RHS repeat-associated protein
MRCSDQGRLLEKVSERLKDDTPQRSMYANLSKEPDGQGKNASEMPPASIITLPKGGGAVRGIGEKFSVNPVTGTGSLSVPIFTSPGRSDFSPKLSLAYDSGSGNGSFGLGWHLSIPSITRKTDKGLPLYVDASESDVFILSDAEDLVPTLERQGNQWLPIQVSDGIWGEQNYFIKRYRPRIEGLFARIERWQRKGDSDIHWRAVTKDNVTSIYGLDPNCRIADPTDSARVFKWFLETTFDDRGNVIFHEYKAEDATGIDSSSANERNRQNGSAPFTNLYVKRICYGAQTPYQIGEDLSKRADWFFEVVFDYGEHDPATPTPTEEPTRKWGTRADPFSSFRSTFEIRTYRLCQRILMFHHFPKGINGESGYDGLVKSTGFTYDQEDPSSEFIGNPIATKLVSVTQTGYNWDNTGKSYVAKSIPPVEFTYSEAEVDPTVQTVELGSLENLPSGLDGSNYQWLDLDGEGLSGILTQQAGALYYKRNLSPGNAIILDGAEQTFARFGVAELLVSRPALCSSGDKPQFMDLAGDGHQNLVSLDRPERGYYERTDLVGGGNSWDEFQPFQGFPNLNSRDPNLKFIDIDGDGLADILVSEDEVFAWYRSYGQQGFGSRQYARKPYDEERGAALVFADPTQSIFLADMTGDRLTDIVRIRSGEVCYWPNLGYGRFGAKVSMDRSPSFDPPDIFDPRRIRLADIDGCGTTDILYLAARGVAIYHNQSGNSWSEATTLTNFPALTNTSLVSAVDLLGNGTACLVWSSLLPSDAGRQMQYIDLMGGQKPHLLISITNNLGAETRIRYASSTKFYVQDREAGTPWATKLGFPVHVAERVEVFDFVGRTRLVSTYRYRHGYFDGVEREFRGFGYIEKADAESFGDSGSLFTEDTDTEVEALHVPPVVTKTWLHTGAWPDEETIIQYMALDYYGAPSPAELQYTQKLNAFLASLLPDTVLPADVLQMAGARVPYSLTGEEQREAIRALKGSILRQEIYANDGSAKAAIPYSVSARNYTIECFQPQGANPYGVFFTHARETIDYRYERNPAGPRVAHNAVLQVDPFGDALQSITIAYGRNLAGSGLPSAPSPTPGTAPNIGVDPSEFVQPEQLSALLTLQENSFTQLIDNPTAYRGPMRSETCVYELTRPARPDDSVVYLFEDLNSLATTALVIPYERPPDLTKTQKRLVSDVRSLYFKNDLSGPAAFGQTESLGLVFENYKLALTANLAQQVFINANANPNKPLSVAALDAILSSTGSIAADGSFTNAGGGYVNSQGDSNWWIPSGQTMYSPVPQNPPNPFIQDVSYAAANFYLPQGHRDPFGQYTRLTYDSYNVLLQQTQDALGNTVLAQSDYRVLQPEEVVDPNNNHIQVAFDALGMVVGTAVKGKVSAPGSSESGDSFATFTADLAQSDIDSFINNGNPLTLAPGLLGTATTRIIYDLERFRASQTANPTDPTQWEPNFAATIARETHSGALPAGQLSKVQVGFSYSDGLGREIQKKAQAEPGPLDLTDPAAPVVNPRWIGSGWTILNNKGKPVRQYEPFFSPTQDFEFANKVGVTSTLFYDPLERVVATLHPDATWEKVVFDSWRQTSWDGNDTVQFDPKTDPDAGNLFSLLPDTDYLPTWYQLRTNPASAAAAFPDAAVRASQLDAANKAAAHNNTPSAAVFDVLGRQFLSVAHNRVPVNGVATDQFYGTRTELDIEGNKLSVTDALGRQVMVYAYDQVKNNIQSSSLDAGQLWLLANVAGKPISRWDSRDYARTMSYDELQRPAGLTVTGNGLNNSLVEKIVYGDSKQGSPAAPDQTNCRGKVYQAFDAAGAITSLGVNPVTNLNEGYDFKGNLLRGQRQLLTDYKDQADWNQNPALHSEIFTHSVRYDALNRVIQQTAPHSNSAGTTRNIVQPGYNEANLLETLDTWLQQDADPSGLLVSAGASSQTITNLDHDEKGQRTLVEYGNGVSTAYTYDTKTFRLIRLLTTRKSDGVSLQDLRYYYDPVGNVTHIQDDADVQNVVYFQNRRVEPSADYTYDAIYRLIQATGREHLGQTGGVANAPTPQSYNDWPNINLPHPNDGNAMGTYAENFSYDPVGNIGQLQHQGSSPSNPGWTRTYAYNEGSLLEAGRQSNRLSSTTVGGTTESYSVAGNGYDSHGNMLRMPQLQIMQWGFKDQLQMTQRQAVNSTDQGGTQHQGERTYYVYDATGERVVKATESSTGVLRKQRLYLGGFEIYREFDSTANVTLERQTLHVMDDKQRVALIEMLTQGAEGSPQQLIRFQFGNQLGSACLELDDQAQLITYEEYFPYGSTSYQAVTQAISPAAKRYRYTGKERDEESGLNYHGARYYALWLGRWVAADPIGIAGGLNAYGYVSGNPIRLIDIQGTDGVPPPVPQSPPAPQPLPPPSPPPQFQVQFLPLRYSSEGSQVGTDTGALALAAAKALEKTPGVQALEKKVLDTLKDQFLLSLKSDPVGTVAGVGPFALDLAALGVALAVTNIKLDLPIAGPTSGRTIVAPLVSAGLEGGTGALTGGRFKLGVGYTEDPQGKPTYSATVTIQDPDKGDGKDKGGDKDKDKKSLKVEADIGAHPGVKSSVTVPFHVGAVKIDIVGKVAIPTGPETPPGSPFKPDFTKRDPFLEAGVVDITPPLGRTITIGVVVRWGSAAKPKPQYTLEHQ